jgi:DNA-binding FadR family transcriptional regulator
MTMYDRIGVLSLLFQNYTDVLPTLHEDLPIADAEHRAIAQAVAAGDSEAARSGMQAHLRRARTEIDPRSARESY